MKNVAEINEIVSSLTFALSGWCGVGCAKDFSAAIFMLISVCSFGRLYRFQGFFFRSFVRSLICSVVPFGANYSI